MARGQGLKALGNQIRTCVVEPVVMARAKSDFPEVGQRSKYRWGWQRWTLRNVISKRFIRKRKKEQDLGSNRRTDTVKLNLGSTCGKVQSWDCRS